MTRSIYPLHSLTVGSWFKLICGASYQHLPAIRNLALAYTLAGADCIDVAADRAVMAAARAGIAAAAEITQIESPPWLMVSVNDGEDPHFRKAQFEANACPSDCPRPCLGVCPAAAIVFEPEYAGILDRLCYGCGRCLPICPSNLIAARERIVSVAEVIPWLEEMQVEAIEIHTRVGNYERFMDVWQQIAPQLPKLKLIAISCNDDPQVIEYLHSLYGAIAPLPVPLIWQTDGRSMSGDLGKGTTHEAIALARKILAADLQGYVQLAGGTNDYTVVKLKREGLLQQTRQNYPDASAVAATFAGVAYGSYARSLLAPIIAELEQVVSGDVKLEQNSQLLEQAVNTAINLVSQLKSPA